MRRCSCLTHVGDVAMGHAAAESRASRGVEPVDALVDGAAPPQPTPQARTQGGVCGHKSRVECAKRHTAAASSPSAAHGTRVCHHVALGQCARFQQRAPRVPERLQAAGPGLRPVTPRLAGPGAPARLRPAGGRQGARPAAWRGGGAVSSGHHNPKGACPTGLWHNSV